MKKTEKTIIHVEYKGEHSYFATLNAIYDVFKVEEIGKAYGSLRNFVISEENPYQYNDFIVRRGVVKIKKNVKDERGNPNFKNDKK